jgi:DNA-binding winged helix-turn-helix (wHTH) protein
MDTHLPHTSDLNFGPYHLDGLNGLLWQGPRVIPLSPKATAVLWQLARRAGQLVSKAELFRAIWPETAVSDGVLAVCIRELRRALGDEAQRPRYIATVHRRGYRFIPTITAAPKVVDTPEMSRQKPFPSGRFPLTTQHSAHSTVSFVGREAELSQLARAYAQTCRGHRQMLFVTGETGMGKTTLVDTFTTRLSQDGPVLIGRGQCVEQCGAGEAYLPLLEALSQLGREPAAEMMIAHLRHYAPSWLVQLPGVMDEEERAALWSWVQGTTQTRMLRELAEALEALTNIRLLVLVLEDLHWSDSSTVEALAMLARRREAAQLLVIGTYRPVELVVRAHPLKAAKQELQLHRQCAEVPLGRLTRAEVQAYLAQRVPAPAATADLSAWVYQRTEGHPLFMVHVVDDLAHQKQLTDVAAAGGGAGPFTELTLEVPAGLQLLIELQLGRLSPETQQVLEVASIVGVEFAVASVAAGVPMAIDAIEAICEELARLGQFITDLGLAEWPDGTVTGRYGFRHALYQEVLYRRIGSGRRVQYHRAIGIRLEVGHGAQASSLAAELAVHFEQGRDYRRAVHYLRQAAANVMRHATSPEALRHLTQYGLDLMVSGLSRAGPTTEPRGTHPSPEAGAPLYPSLSPALCGSTPSMAPGGISRPGTGRGVSDTLYGARVYALRGLRDDPAGMGAGRPRTGR